MPENSEIEFAPAKQATKPSPLLHGAIEPLTHRCISADICSKYNYSIGTHHNSQVEIATYYDKKSKPVAQKIRTQAEKKFYWTGAASEAQLYGQHLFRPQKRLIICEGEIDTLSVAQIHNGKWPVVGIQNGCASASKSIQNALEWIEQFETVVLCFDQDEAGHKAAADCAAIISPGKAQVAVLPAPFNDANEMLCAGKAEDLNSALWQAQTHKPQEIVSGTDLWETIKDPLLQSDIRYPYEGLNKVLHGLRPCELIVICAGSGLGKSQLTKEIAYSLVQQEVKVGVISLEESVRRAALGFVGLAIDRPVHLPHVHKTVDQKLLHQGFEKTLGTNKIHFLEAFGALDPDELIPRIRYLVKGMGCSAIVLDHISMLASGSEQQNEVKFIDGLMTRLRTMCQELSIILICVSHLKRPMGQQGHEEGKKTSLSDLRGSGSIGQLADICLGMERNPMDPEAPDRSTIRILKNRFTGILGVHAHLDYDHDTGRLTEGVGDEL